MKINEIRINEAFGGNIKSPPFQNTAELEKAYMQLCDLRTQYETIIDMQKEEMKESFLAGYSEGRIKGFDEGSSGHNRVYNSKEETPEEAYEYWVKHDRGTT
jgi:hypothetical protein